MKFDAVRHTIKDHIATVVIDNPPVNALGSEEYGEIYETFYLLSREEDVRVIVLTSENKRFFGGGSNIKEFASLNETTGPLYTARNNGVRDYLYQYPKPIICAMNGSAYGGGVGLAIVSDIRLAVADAHFNLGEINMGILGLTQHFMARCHNGAVRKLVYTGEKIDAQEALRIGLIDEILEKDALMPRAYQLAEEIASKSPIAIKLAKQCMLRGEEYKWNGYPFERECLSVLWGTEDHKEAVAAFLEKREPVFQNR